ITAHRFEKSWRIRRTIARRASSRSWPEVSEPGRWLSCCRFLQRPSRASSTRCSFPTRRSRRRDDEHQHRYAGQLPGTDNGRKRRGERLEHEQPVSRRARTARSALDELRAIGVEDAVEWTRARGRPGRHALRELRRRWVRRLKMGARELLKAVMG